MIIPIRFLGNNLEVEVTKFKEITQATDKDIAKAGSCFIEILSVNGKGIEESSGFNEFELEELNWLCWNVVHNFKQKDALNRLARQKAGFNL